MSEFHTRDLASNRELLNNNQENESSAATFVRSFVYAGLQNPINGAAQLLDKSTGSNTLPNLQFIDAPKYNTLASDLGGAAASMAHSFAMLATAHKLGGPVNDVAAFAKRTAIAGGLGTFYGGVLTPTYAQYGDNGFAASRLENAFIGGAGMAGMSAFSSFYRDTLAKGVSFGEVPHYHALALSSTVAIPFLADGQLGRIGREDSVFMPGAKLRPAENYFNTPPEKPRR